MYGIIGQMMATPGERENLARILLNGCKQMPGCLSYVVAKDPQHPDALWITEVWQDQESHQASLQLASVREAIAQGRPLIAGFGQRVETGVIGGQGL